MVAIVKGRRGRHNAETERRLIHAFSKLDFSKDTIGRRSYFAVWIIGELRLASELPKIIAATWNPLASVTNAAAEALGKIGEVQTPKGVSNLGEEGMSTLEKSLTSGYYRTRIHAAEAIRRVNGVKLIPALRMALKEEPLLDVRIEMERTIKSLEG